MEKVFKPEKPDMFTVNSIVSTTARQKELFMFASLLKNLPKTQIIQLCSASPPKGLSKENVTDSIPCLPVQPLEQMLEKYIKSIKPFVDSSQLENTIKIAQKFCQDANLGKKLQQMLQERAKLTKNWLSDWWLSVAYLDYRNPVIVYSSPGMVWPEQKFKNQDEQLIFTAQIIENALKFNELIEKNKIPQEKLSGRYSLCMSQYTKIFGTCRIPSIPSDKLIFQDMDKPSTNIIVIYNNHLFSIPAFQNEGREPLSYSEFYGMLKEIVAEGDKSSCAPIGVLTTEHRDKWAFFYEELKKDKMNKQLLETFVEKALFVVCLEKPLALGSGLNYETRCSKLLLHGFGLRGNAGNRWYDKTVQFIVGAYNDGIGIAYEHSPAEGGPIGILTDFILDNMKNVKTMELSSSNIKPKKLDFFVSDVVKKGIDSASEAVNKISDELDVFGWSFSHFGKDTLKKLKVSPDSFIQVGIQLAFYKLHNRPAAQYESGSLRKYIYGRTDTIRTCSEEVVNFCKLISDPNASIELKEQTLRVALASHKKYAEDVIDGRGVDRHLLGFKILAKMHNMKDLEILSDVAFQRSTYFQLSTSNVPTKCNGFMVYGPLVDDGYACCYNPRNYNINFGTSAWSTCRETRLNGFQNALEEALIEMKDCLSFFSLSYFSFDAVKSKL